MCTLIVAHRVFNGFPLVIAANRDERLDRVSEPPEIRGKNSLILSPKDQERGGTWIGVNKFGVFIALTNRLDVKSQPRKLSRGTLVMELLQMETARKAFDQSRCYNDKPLNGFNMVIADKNCLFLLRGNGTKIERSWESSGLLVVTNHGIGRLNDEDVPKRVATILKTWTEKNIGILTPSLSNIRPLLNIHDNCRHGTCINEPENSYGTKSSAIIKLYSDGHKEKWQYWHRERRSYEHICTEGFQKMIELHITKF